MTAIIILSVIGILVLLAELVLPGGLLGIVGAICLVAAVVLTFTEFGPTAGAVALAALFVFGICTLGWWMKFFHRLPITSRMILQSESASEEKEAGSAPALVGRTGEAVTDLVPSGHALIDGEKRGVMSEAGFIPKGTPIEIIDHRGPSLLVAPVEEQADQEKT